MQLLPVNPIYAVDDKNVLNFVKLNIGVVISNVLTIYAATNRLSYVGRAPTADSWLTDLIDYAASDAPASLGALRGNDSIEVRQALRTASEELKRLLTEPLQQHESCQDYGSTLVTTLSTANLVSTYRYDRRELQIPTTYVEYCPEIALGEMSPGYLPAPWAPASLNFARILAAIDICKATTEAVPLMGQQTEAASSALRSVTEISTFIKALEDTIGVGLLYAAQLPALVAAIQEPSCEMLGDMATMYAPNLAGRVTRMLTALKEWRTKVPLHPLCAWIASACRALHTSTRWNGPIAAGVLLNLDIEPDALRESFMATLAEDYGSRRRTLPWGQDWVDPAPNAPNPVGLTYPQVVGALRSLGERSTAHWPKVTSSLGWGAVAVPEIKLMMDRPSIIVSDGDKYSGPPAAIVLGLAATLPSTHEWEQSLATFVQTSPACQGDWPNTAVVSVLARYSAENSAYHVASMLPGHAYQGQKDVAWASWPNGGLRATASLVADEFTDAFDWFTGESPMLTFAHPHVGSSTWLDSIHLSAITSAFLINITTFDASWVMSDTPAQELFYHHLGQELVSGSNVAHRPAPFPMSIAVETQCAEEIQVYVLGRDGVSYGVESPNGIATVGAPLTLTFDGTAVESIRGTLAATRLRASAAAVDDVYKVYDVRGTQP
jgi:hypothetical protein